MSRLACLTSAGLTRSRVETPAPTPFDSITRSPRARRHAGARTAKSAIDKVEPRAYGAEKSVTGVSRVSLALSEAGPRVHYQYVAGIPPVGAAFKPTQSGTLLLGAGTPGNKLTLGDVVEAILGAIRHGDTSAPPNQRAGFHSLSLRLDFPGVPYNLRSVFIDLGRSPVVPGATSRTYAIAAGRLKLAGVSEGAGEAPTLVEFLETLKGELSARRDAPEPGLRAWERPVI